MRDILFYRLEQCNPRMLKSVRRFSCYSQGCYPEWNAISETLLWCWGKKKMNKKTSKRTILLETSHEMRKEIVERNKKHEMSQVATQRKRNKTGRKSISGERWAFTLWQWRCKDIWPKVNNWWWEITKIVIVTITGIHLLQVCVMSWFALLRKEELCLAILFIISFFVKKMLRFLLSFSFYTYNHGLLWNTFLLS